MLINLIIVILVLIISAFVVAAEFAIVQTPIYTLTTLQDERLKTNKKPSKRLTTAIEMIHLKSEYLSTTQIIITMSGLILGITSEPTVSQPLEMLGVPSQIASILAIIIMTLIEVVLTELYPKNIAIAIPLKVSLLIAIPLKITFITLKPFVKILIILADLLTHLTGFQSANEVETSVSEQELLQLTKLSANSQSSNIEKDDFTLISRVIAFGNKKSAEIGIDAKHFIQLEQNNTLDNAIQLINDHKINRILITNQNKIIGYVYLYDIIDLMNQYSKQQLATMLIKDKANIRPILAINDTMPIVELFRNMQATRISIAIVSRKETPIKLVTTKDINEELFGEIHTEDIDIDEQLIAN